MVGDRSLASARARATISYLCHKDSIQLALSLVKKCFPSRTARADYININSVLPENNNFVLCTELQLEIAKAFLPRMTHPGVRRALDGAVFGKPGFVT